MYKLSNGKYHDDSVCNICAAMAVLWHQGDLEDLARLGQIQHLKELGMEVNWEMELDLLDHLLFIA